MLVQPTPHQLAPAFGNSPRYPRSLRHYPPRQQPVAGSRQSLVAHAAQTVQALPTISKDEVLTNDAYNNIPELVFDRMGEYLHCQESHPICITKQAIYDYFNAQLPGQFRQFDTFKPIVPTKAAFDELLIPEDHVSRRPNDTYYVNPQVVLRPHTSAHQGELLREGHEKFLVTGDVYRRDEVDATHYPVFHQMEGMRVFQPSEWEAAGMEGVEFVEKDLKATLEGLAKHLFGDVECRWVDAYFPFTEPSFELEIFYNDDWMEVLGCGVVQQSIVDDHHRNTQAKAWAFGMGMERLAMVLFKIPDIRLFWSKDERFTSQFEAGKLDSTFQSFSKHPPNYKDITFWVSDAFTLNSFCELVRGVAGDLVEDIELIDNFTHPKKQRTSNCFRITYRSMERALTNEEINDLQETVRRRVEEELGVELR